MSIELSNYFLLTANLGGEILRLESVNADGTARKLLLTNDTKDDTVVTLPDLGTGSTKTLWTAATSNLTRPLGMVVLIDPSNLYEDELDRSTFVAGTAPCISVGVYTADAVAGVLTTPATPSNEALSMVVDVYREIPFVLPGNGCRTAIDTATQDRAVSKIVGRSNMASGFGPIKARCLVVG